MPDHMPCIRFLDEREATTLVVTMADSGSELEVDLIYGKNFSNFDVLLSLTNDYVCSCDS